MIYVKVFKNHMRDLEFSSSERRGNGGPRAPKRIFGENSFLTILTPKSANFGQKWINEHNSHFLHHGAKRLVNVMVFGYFWRPEMQRVSFGAKFHHFRILGAKMRKVG